IDPNIHRGRVLLAGRGVRRGDDRVRLGHASLGLWSSWPPCPRTGSSHPPEHMGEELPSAAYLEMAIERRNVLMGCGLAEAEPRSNLLFAVAFQQTDQRLTQPGRELVWARFGGTDQRFTDQSAKLRKEETGQSLRSRRKRVLARRA